MSPPFRPARMAALRPASDSQIPRLALLLAAAVMLQGCTAALPLAGPHPADPGARVPPVTYRSSLGDFRRAETKEPAPWTGGPASSPSEKSRL